MDARFWTTHEITKLTGLKRPTVMGLVNERHFPPPTFILGRRLRVWRKSDVLKWWTARKRRKAT